MSVSIEKLRSFTYIAEDGQFLRAAQRLGITQPTLSARIREMEEELGVRLFARTTRQVELTAEGVRFLHRAKQILSYLDLAISEARQQADLTHGRIAIAATPSIISTLLPPLMADFREQFPNIEISLHENVSPLVDDLVRTGICDFGLGPGHDRHLELTFSLLFAERFFAIVPKGHDLGVQKAISLRELIEYGLILMSTGTGIRDVVEEMLQSEGLSINTQYQLRQRESLISLVEAGLGVALLPELSLHQTRFRDIRIVPVQGHPITRKIGLIEKKGGSKSNASAAFVQLLRSRQLWEQFIYQPS